MSPPLPDRPFPDFLAPAFAPEMLGRIDATIAVLDPRAEILWVNAAWDAFAHANGAPDLARHRSYLDGIAGPLRAYYEEVFERAMATGEVYEQDYECSSVEQLRRYRMRVLPFPARGLVVEHTEITLSSREEQGEPAIDARFLGADGMIVQCSNCRRVRDPQAAETERWTWVPDWAKSSPAHTSHGICTPCVGFYWRRGRAR